jgi:NTE family protein
MPTPSLSLQSPGSTPVNRRVALVLGGGGLKGFAHIGVLRALAERGIVPDVYAGTSIGALISAAHIGGTPVDELTARA